MTGFIPSGGTRLFPVVGDPIAQVRSPEVITSILAARGEDAVVVPMHVSPPNLCQVLSAIYEVQNLSGALVTVPHKHAALSHCASVTDRARFVQAVNVVRRTDDGWHGDNTDGQGYLDGIEREGFVVRGKRALLVGCGGAGAAIALEILERGAAQLAVHDIDLARRDEVIERLSERFPGLVVAGSADPTGFALVANATPMGMNRDDPLPVDVSMLEPWQFVACVVTKPAVPPLIAEARRLGCPTMTGTGMFDAQAETLADFLLGYGWGGRILVEEA
ncbi:shikimate dehydrogenase family protein [Mesorhizobium sp. ANAO-SY3R2]|uniref:shikimate dehydrogenase family protein n=1 Tax=Mesorhizobium sp. ANAO-SY3R2 TaxID=3166644 RepID=UPI00366D1C05